MRLVVSLAFSSGKTGMLSDMSHPLMTDDAFPKECCCAVYNVEGR